ncbi:peptidoglycan DD-metalloendopeptidase family protein [Microbacterium sp. 179-I 3D2 NHS]|uniref:peptidoglycan DD-metalloendopeptidase family protein n=1 Tax=Microbacterium sp. 179-I 3D2 NHS TaxID=3235178 RepID=UPI0039A3662F
MKRTSRWRLARAAIVAALALVAGVLVPAASTLSPAAAATDGQMVYPASGNIQSKVGDGCRGNYRAHEGIDITGAGGAPILAAYDGVIKVRTSNSGYGYYTDIEHPGGYTTRYGHMASPGYYPPGTRVTRGQEIGIVGKTGATSAYHLHFEVRLNGAVYTAINGGFTCLSNVTRGTLMPLVIPGLGTGPRASIASADYNGDGRADLLVVAGNADLQLRTGLGGGSFHAPSTPFVAFADYRRHITHTEFTGDGRADLLVARGDGVLELFPGTGTGGFQAGRTVGNGWYDMLHITSGADYTGDGKQDVVAVSSTGVMTIYRGNGAGGFATPYVVLGGGWEGFRSLVGGDFDNDGRGDLIGIDDTGTLYFYPGVANGFGARRSIGDGWLEFTAVTGGVDYTSDDRADLLGRTPSGELYVYPGLGNGTFNTRVLVGADWAAHLAIE